MRVLLLAVAVSAIACSLRRRHHAARQRRQRRRPGRSRRRPLQRRGRQPARRRLQPPAPLLRDPTSASRPRRATTIPSGPPSASMTSQCPGASWSTASSTAPSSSPTTAPTAAPIRSPPSRPSSTPPPRSPPARRPPIIVTPDPTLDVPVVRLRVGLHAACAVLRPRSLRGLHRPARESRARVQRRGLRVRGWRGGGLVPLKTDASSD